MNLAQKPAMALIWAPIHHPRPSLQYWGTSEFYGPGPSQWAQAIWWRKCNPHGPWTVGHTKDQKGPKRCLITIPSQKAIAMARTQNTQEGP
ncbi:hypothetical protein O181_094614 [Austropuccinia psidii MF-1]|uniref:Uncharacterized protein n=1 Tax=Austropuccinia psidii MF-1 TaxID=1389203 RepID=A0A9Q3PAZ4_9BASI|nr:hypothetical protein [Austropuccinia psidii MF-1]